MAKKSAPPDESGQIMQQMLATNAKAAQHLVDSAQKEYDLVAAERQAARDHLATVKADKQKYTDKFYAAAVDHLKKDILQREEAELAGHLLEKGMTIKDVVALLDIPDDVVQNMARTLRIQLMLQKEARITYEDQGRSGYINVQWDKHVNRFSWEFGGHDAMVVIDIPTSELWEKQTGWPLANRNTLLQYIALQVISDQARGHDYRIDDNAIIILR